MSTFEHEITITRIPADTFGNGRFATHFLDWLAPAEIREAAQRSTRLGSHLSELYELALKRARKVGGRKYHNKSYGGGIALQAYGRDDVISAITQALNAALKLAQHGYFLRSESTGYLHVVRVIDGRILSTHTNPGQAAEIALQLIDGAVTAEQLLA
jgi:hypothetical protein